MIKQYTIEPAYLRAGGGKGMSRDEFYETHQVTTRCLLCDNKVPYFSGSGPSICNECMETFKQVKLLLKERDRDRT